MRNKIFVMINVFGLGIALACAIVGYFNYKLDSDFDSFHKDRDIIYKISMTNNASGPSYEYGLTPMSLGPAIENSISGIEEVVRYTPDYNTVRYEENIAGRNVGYGDPNFFEMFDIPMLVGNGNSISDPKNIIISERLAEILFAEKEALGKTITFYKGNENMTLIVSGVFKDLPMISSFNFGALTSIENYIKLNKVEEHSWGNWVGATFIKVSDAQRIPIIHEHLKGFVALQNDANKGFPVESFFIERMKDIPHSGRNMGYYWLRPGIHPAIIYLSATMGFIILLLACINFMNTSLAISSRRLKEVGISKVLGGIRRHTIFQFLGENIILCFIALFFALTISPFLIDAWSTPFANLDLNMSFLNGLRFWIFLVVLLILTAILSGAYPSIYMARFSPVKILKGSIKFKSGGWFSKILLILQFLLATISIVAAVIFIQNA